MVKQHHRLNGHEFEQTSGDSEGQGSLACCSPWGHKQVDATWQLNNNNNALPAASYFICESISSLCGVLPSSVRICLK